MFKFFLDIFGLSAEAPAPDRKPEPKAKIKVAIDESVGKVLAKMIEERGYKIVCRAGHAEPDAVWMRRAYTKGALFIISPDLDIPSTIERENYPMVWIDFLFADVVNPTLNTLDPVTKKKLWAQYVHDRIQAKLKFLHGFGGSYE